MRYIVIATRLNQYMRMGWDTMWEQLACAERYWNQGWTIELMEEEQV
jgi:hypothetical protein